MAGRPPDDKRTFPLGRVFALELEARSLRNDRLHRRARARPYQTLGSVR